VAVDDVFWGQLFSIRWIYCYCHAFGVSPKCWEISTSVLDFFDQAWICGGLAAARTSFNRLILELESYTNVSILVHIPFSVAIRSSFGYYFAYFAIVSRSILAMFWLGIQGASGAQCMTIMISAIWPSYANIKNTIPLNQGITSQGMIRFVSA